MKKHPRRTTSRPVTKQFRLKLRPGDRLVTPTMMMTARRRGGSGGLGVNVSLTCSCTEGEPNKPECVPKSTTSPDGHTITVKCVKSGGCTKCSEKKTTTTSSVFIA